MSSDEAAWARWRTTPELGRRPEGRRCQGCAVSVEKLASCDEKEKPSYLRGLGAQKLWQMVENPRFQRCILKETRRLRNMPVAEVLREAEVSEVTSTKVVVEEPAVDVYSIDSRRKFMMQLTIQLTAKSWFVFHFPVSENLIDSQELLCLSLSSIRKSASQGRLRENLWPAARRWWWSEDLAIMKRNAAGDRAIEPTSECSVRLPVWLKLNVPVPKIIFLFGVLPFPRRGAKRIRVQQQQSIQLAKSSSSAEAASAVYESLLSGRFLERPGRSIFPDFTSNDVLNTLFPARTTAQIATEALDRATEAIERHGVKAIEQAGVYVCNINVSIFDNSENGNVHITGRAVESLKAASVAVSRQRNLFSHKICMGQQLMQLANAVSCQVDSILFARQDYEWVVVASKNWKEYWKKSVLWVKA